MQRFIDIGKSAGTRHPSRRTALLWLALSVAWLTSAGSSAAGDAPTYRVIVHAENPSRGVSREFATNAFLKRVTRWDGGERLLPVDLPPTSPLRQRFSEAVLGRSVAAVRKYWQQQIFSGRGLPPPELESEQAVVSYVSKNRGGIGYVGPGVELHGVKVLTVR